MLRKRKAVIHKIIVILWIQRHMRRSNTLNLWIIFRDEVKEEKKHKTGQCSKNVVANNVIQKKIVRGAREKLQTKIYIRKGSGIGVRSFEKLYRKIAKRNFSE